MIGKPTTHDDEIDEPEELNDEDATLTDDLLDEVSGDSIETDDTVEGFGILPDVAEDEEETDKKDEEDEDHELEDDAEDVDFDRFDDIDEM